MGKTWKDKIDEITFWDLIEDDVLKDIYKMRDERIKEIDWELWKNEKIRAIKDWLDDLHDWPIGSIDLWNNQKIIFDISSQKINIWTESFSIKLNTYWVTISKIEKKGDNIIIIPEMPVKDISDRKSIVAIDTFSKSLTMLITNWKMELKDDEWSVIWVVEKDWA